MKPAKGEQLTIALTKGRILSETVPLLAEAGVSPLESVEESRKLIFPTTMEGVSLVILRGSDVPTYVRHGAADVGVVGKDLLMESGDEGQPLFRKTTNKFCLQIPLRRNMQQKLCSRKVCFVPLRVGFVPSWQ